MAIPNDPNRYFTAIYNTNHGAPSLNYIFDPALVLTGSNPPVTGGWRAETTLDFASSGGAGSNVNITNPILAVSGVISVSVPAPTGTTITSVTGSYALIGLNAITGSQIQIPVNSISYGIYVESGSAYVNGILFNAGTFLNGGGFADATLLNTAINVGCTGSTGLFACRTIVSWEM